MKVVLYGAGGHARVVLDAARAQGLDVVAVIDDHVELHGRTLDEVEIVGDENVLDELRGRGVEGAIIGVGSIEPNPLRAALYERLVMRRFSLPVVRHPNGIIASSAQLGDATVVFAAAVINPHARLGRNVIVNTAAVIEHDCVIADHVHLSPGALLAGGVSVGEGTHVGIGAVILQGVRVGASALIGAGAVVVRDVSDGQRVVGVPARPIS